jgi:hypothetical protein
MDSSKVADVEKAPLNRDDPIRELMPLHGDFDGRHFITPQRLSGWMLRNAFDLGNDVSAQEHAATGCLPCATDADTVQEEPSSDL